MLSGWYISGSSKCSFAISLPLDMIRNANRALFPVFPPLPLRCRFPGRSVRPSLSSLLLELFLRVFPLPPTLSPLQLLLLLLLPALSPSVVVHRLSSTIDELCRARPSAGTSVGVGCLSLGKNQFHINLGPVPRRARLLLLSLLLCEASPSSKSSRSNVVSTSKHTTRTARISFAGLSIVDTSLIVYCPMDR